MEKIIEINNVKKSFNNIKVLDGVTLSISKGEIYGLLGLNVPRYILKV
jgi:ABC-2 type transport system ATP-binding protein